MGSTSASAAPARASTSRGVSSPRRMVQMTWNLPSNALHVHLVHLGPMAAVRLVVAVLALTALVLAAPSRFVMEEGKGGELVRC